MDFVTEDAQTIQTILWLSPAAYKRSVQTLRDVFGLNGDFRALANGTPLPHLEATIVCEEEEYTSDKGITSRRVKVKWINMRGQGKAPPANVPDLLKRLEQSAAENDFEF